MTEPVLLDTGPIVASFDKSDANHDICNDLFARLLRPPITCWPVLTEAVWRLRTSRRSVLGVFDMVDSGTFQVAQVGREACVDLSRFITRYHSARADLADAMLMYLADRDGFDTVFTLDRRDFLIYRTTDGRALNVIPDA